MKRWAVMSPAERAAIIGAVATILAAVVGLLATTLSSDTNSTRGGQPSPAVQPSSDSGAPSASATEDSAGTQASGDGFRQIYPTRRLLLPCVDYGAYVELDDASVSTDTDDQMNTELDVDACSRVVSTEYSTLEAWSDHTTPTTGPADCAEAIETAPLELGGDVNVVEGDRLCVRTDLGNIAIVTVGPRAEGRRLVIRVRAWAPPRG